MYLQPLPEPLLYLLGKHRTFRLIGALAGASGRTYARQTTHHDLTQPCYWRCKLLPTPALSSSPVLALMYLSSSSGPRAGHLRKPLNHKPRQSRPDVPLGSDGPPRGWCTSRDACERQRGAACRMHGTHGIVTAYMVHGACGQRLSCKAHPDTCPALP